MKFHTQKNWLKWWHFKQTLTSNIVRFHIFYMDEDGEIINNPVRNMQGIDTQMHCSWSNSNFRSMQSYGQHLLPLQVVYILRTPSSPSYEWPTANGQSFSLTFQELARMLKTKPKGTCQHHKKSSTWSHTPYCIPTQTTT